MGAKWRIALSRIRPTSLSGTAVTPEQVLTAVQFANTVQGAKSVTNDIQVK